MDMAVRTLQVTSTVVDDYGYVARRLREDEAAQFAALTGQPFHPDALARTLLALPGLAYSVLGTDGYPLLLGGFIPQRPGAEQAWLAGTQAGWDRHWRSFTRIARAAIRARLEHAHRVEVVSLASRHKAHAWYEVLGLVDEGLAAKWFADGQDARVHAIVRRGG